RVETRRDAQGVLAADRDERVDVFEGRTYRVDAAVDLVRVRAGRPDDRAAPRQDPGDLRCAERLEVLLDHPAPALADADHLVAVGPRASCDRADDRVQSGAVATAGEDADAHRARVYGPPG